MRGDSDYEQIKRVEAELNSRLPPGSRWHQYWCAIFHGKPCDCDDDDRPPVTCRLLGGGGAAAPKKRKRRQVAAAARRRLTEKETT
jgi:hypothetical protein